MRPNIGSDRPIALTDGVVAVVIIIIIIIMVLELKPPHGADLASLARLVERSLKQAGLLWKR